MNEITIAGAGLTGTLLAARLGAPDRVVNVHERRLDPRATPAGDGRSINLAISTRGLDALERVGLAGPARTAAVAMRARMIHAVDGTLTSQPYGTAAADHLLSIDRDVLAGMLLEAAAFAPGVDVHFGERVSDLDLDLAGGGVDVVVESADGSRRHRSDALFGSDGAFSVVRRRLVERGRVAETVDELGHGYKELTIPASPDGHHVFEPEALHIWPRGSHMLIALPNADGSFTATLFWPLAGPLSFHTVTVDDVDVVFAELFADAAEAIGADLAHQYDENPTSTLVSVRAEPWHIEDRVVLVGDAAHAVVPFYGQGANAALEDVTVICDLLAESDRGRAFAAFSRRHVDTDALAELAMDNFVEMRDRVASRTFLALAALRRLAHRVAPRHYVPLYTMVTFTRIPYAQARRRARRQDRVVAGIVVVLVVAVVVAIVTLAFS